MSIIEQERQRIMDRQKAQAYDDAIMSQQHKGLADISYREGVRAANENAARQAMLEAILL